MALLYRSLLESADATLVEGAPNLFRAWVRHKLRDEAFELPAHGEVLGLDGTGEVSRLSAAGEQSTAFRGILYERRGEEELRTTFTAMRTSEGTWAWVDLERWSTDAYAPAWVPIAPRLVGSVLREHDCHRGPTAMVGTDVAIGPQEAPLLVSEIMDPERRVPIVVVAPTREEREGDARPSHERGAQLCRRLAGVAKVAVLGPGGTSALSRALLAYGEDLDVHSGAIRTYRPAGRQVDLDPRRHPYVLYSRFERRPAEVAAKIVAAPLLRSACAQAPPDVWRTKVRSLPGFPGAETDDREVEEAYSAAQEALEAQAELLERVEAERAAAVELLGENDGLARRVKYLEAELRESDASAAAAPTPGLGFDPAFCSEVVEKAQVDLGLVVIGPAVAGAAEDLDEHTVEVWAKKAWKGLQALQAYAEAKGAGFSGNFRLFCEASGSPQVIPLGWVAMAESETTDNNARFRELRTFDVDEAVAASGRVYMPAHVKIDSGGYPSPRIHFHDDTSGKTGAIHVGWFGDHRDNKSKS